VKSSSDFKALFQSIFVNNAVIQVQPATYLIQSVEGLFLYQRSNVKVYGASGVIFKQALPTAAIPSQVMDLNTCTGVYFYDVVFDQDYQNPNHLPAIEFGVDWVARVAYGSNNWFTRCQFINGVGCGLRMGATSNVHFIDCTIDHCGEHAIYGSNEMSGIYFDSCNVYNYGKYCRGMNKIQESSDVHFTNCLFEPNQDGQGYGTPPSLPGFSADPICGIYGIIISGDSNFYFTGCTWKNANSNTQRNIGLRLTSNIANYNINFNDCHWIGFGSAPVIDAGTCYSSNVAQLHLTGCAFN
jgi:hypothetical protein